VTGRFFRIEVFLATGRRLTPPRAFVAFRRFELGRLLATGRLFAADRRLTDRLFFRAAFSLALRFFRLAMYPCPLVVARKL
jgi:hypothetical protein